MNDIKHHTLGSLFDGIGGFPYAGTFFGIEPVWASEILDSAVSVTKRHLPGMAHVGDITQLKGGELPPVDIITFGSPCQGLSFAGKRLGMADERSGLFSEAIRIIREMREATNGKYPRYALWENVPGALSSGKPAGSDFKAVLEAFTEAEIPFPRSGRWANAGMVRGGGADLAWCVYNAQHFGTAQRRRRVFLIVDFGGGCAGEILFKPKSLCGYFEAGGTSRQGLAAYAQRGAGGSNQPAGDNCLTPWDVQSSRIHNADGTWPANGDPGESTDSLGRGGATECADFGRIAPEVAKRSLQRRGGEGGGRGYCLNPWDTQQSRVTTEDGIAPTLAGADGQGGRNPAGLVFIAAFNDKAGGKAQGIGFEEEQSPTLTGNTPSVVCLNDQGGDSISVEKGEQSPTLRSEMHGNLPVICRASALANAETLEDMSSTLTCYHEQPIVCKAVHQNQEGDINVSDTAYTLTAAATASARNAPLVMTESYGINATSIGRQPHNGGNGLGVQKEISPTLTATDRHGVGGCVHPDVSGTLCASAAGLSRPGGMASEVDLCVAYALQGNMIGRQDCNGPMGSGVNESVSFTLNTCDQHGVAAVFNRQRSDMFKEQDIASTQSARQYKDATDIVCEAPVAAVDCRNLRETDELSGTLQAKESGGYSLNSQNPVRTGFIVRRLTPTECERLQGYPDGWTAFDEHGKPISDSKRYQMLGNSVAVPCVAYILMGMAEQLGKEG